MTSELNVSTVFMQPENVALLSIENALQDLDEFECNLLQALHSGVSCKEGFVPEATTAKTNAVVNEYDNITNETIQVGNNIVNDLVEDIKAINVKITDQQAMLTNMTTQIENNGSPKKLETSRAAVIKNLADLAKIRVQLLEALTALYVESKQKNKDLYSDLVDQTTLKNAVDQHLENAKTTLQQLSGKYAGHSRLAEINTYYAKEYQARSGIMKLLVLTCIPILLIVILKRYKILSNSIASILTSIIFIICIIKLFIKIYNLSKRSYMNYDRIRFKKVPPITSTLRTNVWDYDKKQLGL